MEGEAAGAGGLDALGWRADRRDEEEERQLLPPGPLGQQKQCIPNERKTQTLVAVASWPGTLFQGRIQSKATFPISLLLLQDKSEQVKTV